MKVGICCYICLQPLTKQTLTFSASKTMPKTSTNTMNIFYENRNRRLKLTAVNIGILRIHLDKDDPQSQRSTPSSFECHCSLFFFSAASEETEEVNETKINGNRNVTCQS